MGMKIKKYSSPQKTGVLGRGNLVCFNPREMRRSKAVWKCSSVRGPSRDRPEWGHPTVVHTGIVKA